MITRRDVLSVIGPDHSPSDVAWVLDCIRHDDPHALIVAARLRGTRVLDGLGTQFVAGGPRTLVYTQWGQWLVAPLSLVHRAEALAAVAIVQALPSTVGMELNRLHVSASGSHRTVDDTAHLLTTLVMDGEIEPTGMDPDTWLYGALNAASEPRQWAFDVVA